MASLLFSLPKLPALMGRLGEGKEGEKAYLIAFPSLHFLIPTPYGGRRLIQKESTQYIAESIRTVNKKITKKVEIILNFKQSLYSSIFMRETCC